MANHKPIVSTVRATTCLLFLAIVVTRSTSARILGEELPPVAASIIAPESSNPAISPVADSAVPAEDDALTPAPALASPLVSPTTGATTPVAADAALPHKQVLMGPLWEILTLTTPCSSSCTMCLVDQTRRPRL
ncbi:hypothetical protein AAC387_Pa03g2657 [Persea americana]